MNFGCFGHVSDLGRIRDAGYDSAELDLRELCALSDEKFTLFRRELAEQGLTVYSVSWILPMDLDLTDPMLDKGKWMELLRFGAERCALIGAEVWPFGCGKGRSIKKDRSDSAESQRARVAEFIYSTAEVCGDFGLRLALEPLGPANSNYIQTLSQARQLISELSHPALKLMCDLRHMTAVGDPVAELPRYAGEIIHCHIDLPLGEKRLFPERDDGFDYRPYLQNISALDCGQLAFEAIDGDLGDAKQAIAYIRSLI